MPGVLQETGTGVLCHLPGSGPRLSDSNPGRLLCKDAGEESLGLSGRRGRRARQELCETLGTSAGGAGVTGGHRQESPMGTSVKGQRPISVPRMPVDAPLGPGLFAQLCPAPPAPTLGLALCPAQACRVPAGGWATWACCCSTWPSASWCWSASSAAPRGSW